MVQVVQVVLPLAVDGRQHDEAHDPLAVLAEGLDLPVEAFANGLLGDPQHVSAVHLFGVVLVVDGGEHGVEVEQHPLPQPADLDPLFQLRRGQVILEDGLHGVVDHLPDLTLQVLATLQGEEAEVVDDLALLVHDVVVVQQPFPRFEVVALHPLLGPADGTGDKRVRDDLALLRPHPLHGAGDALHAPEEAHQVVLETEEELRCARITLAARPPAQLAVDPAGFVPLRPQDVKAAVLDQVVTGLVVQLLVAGRIGGRHRLQIQAPFLRPVDGARLGDSRSEFDVRAAPGHVRRDRHRTGPARLDHDLRLALVLLGVEDVVDDTSPPEHA